jgi:transporter family-2 protein
VILYVILAFLNGAFVGISRTINGNLSAKTGSFYASFWNHIVGFIFLTVLLLVTGEWHFNAMRGITFVAYTGGLLGALFVAINSFVLPRVGAMNAALLIIGGQMVSAVILDCLRRGIPPSLFQLFGVLCIVLGVYLQRELTIVKK